MPPAAKRDFVLNATAKLSSNAAELTYLVARLNWLRRARSVDRECPVGLYRWHFV
jgi:hypothetical protein